MCKKKICKKLLKTSNIFALIIVIYREKTLAQIENSGKPDGD